MNNRESRRKESRGGLLRRNARMCGAKYPPRLSFLEMRMSRELLTPTQAAARTRLAPSTLAKLRCRGGGPPFVKLGARVFYVVADLEAWLNSAAVFCSTSEYSAVANRPRGRPRRMPNAQ